MFIRLLNIIKNTKSYYDHMYNKVFQNNMIFKLLKKIISISSTHWTNYMHEINEIISN